MALQASTSHSPIKSCETTYDLDTMDFDDPDAHDEPFGQFSLPFWKEIELLGHQNDLPFLDDLVSPDLTHDTLGGLFMDSLKGAAVAGYESSEDNSEELLKRLQESEELNREQECWKAIGNYCVHVFCNFYSISS
jgi:hypothetical protein